MVDTHTHLYLSDYYPDGGYEATSRSIEAGVVRLVFPNIDVESVSPLLRLHRAFPENTYVAAGLHPTEVGSDWKDDLNEILDLFADSRLVAIGEIGIDLHWDKSTLVKQMDAFGYQLDLALQRGIPAIIHSRDAAEETIEMLKIFSDGAPGIILHSYAYDCKTAERMLEAVPDAMFGFNGVITFKNASTTREAAKFVGINRILSETDAPFLTPVPHRGETNQSSYIPLIVKAIAAATDIEFEAAAEAIDGNAQRIFEFNP